MTMRRVPFDVEALVARSTSRRYFVCEFPSGNPDYAHTVVAETDEVVAFVNRYPTLLFGYVIVAPKRHVALLPPGVPLAQQQYRALNHENGAIDADPVELAAYVRDLRAALG